MIIDYLSIVSCIQTSDGNRFAVFWNQFRIVGPESAPESESTPELVPESAPELIPKTAPESESVLESTPESESVPEPKSALESELAPKLESAFKRSQFRHCHKNRRLGSIILRIDNCKK